MSLTWNEAIGFAEREAIHSYDHRGYNIEPLNPTKEDFIATFTNFYNEITATYKISSYPVDPPAARKMVESRAALIWAEDFPLEQNHDR